MIFTPKSKTKNSVAMIVAIMFLFLLQACTPSPEGRAKKSSASNNATTDNTPGIPQFSSNTNYIQNGSNVITTSLSLELTFNDTLQIRGKSIDSYLRSSGTDQVLCLVTPFKETLTNKVLVLSAIPKTVYNFTNKTLEYYLNISPNDEASNKGFCQKTGLINFINTAHASLPIIYSLKGLCPLNNCLYSTFISSGMELFTQDGSTLVHMATKHLYFSVTNNYPSDTGNVATCTESSQCYSLGFDCCSSGQCVKDLSAKDNVDKNSNEYLQALNDILLNPSNIYLYPHFYNICSQPTNTPTEPTPTNPTTPTTDAATRLDNLESLYNCTNKVEGEMGTCALKFSDVAIGSTYEGGKDARNFSWTFTNSAPQANISSVFSNVEKITYGGHTVFNITSDEINASTNEFSNQFIRLTGFNNDNLNVPFKIEVLRKPTAAVSDEIVVKYRNDASCTYINSNLAKCEKHYIQEQNYVDNSNDPASLVYGLTALEKHRKRATDHYIASNQFILPLYADINRAITITIDGITQKINQDWNLVVDSKSYIQFYSTASVKATRGQKVIINFYSNVAPALLMPSKMQALAKINELCSCNGDTQCNLVPLNDSQNNIVDYACKFPEPEAAEAPLSQKVYLSSKTVPVRFFDQSGINKSKLTTLADKQEGTEFLYTNGDYLKPNNIADGNSENYIGFNEIYGNLRYDNNSAKPALEVAVKKGSSYDILVHGGAISNCLLCGNDYYSQLTKIFPQTSFGSGVEPMRGQTNRINSTNVSVRSDDLKFGRACLVPATMIPWSHRVNGSQAIQRRGRMSAQHFLYSNGYQYDWYGFDYGAVIGSFDGVRWFAIGTNRRIKADTNKLFLAVNTPMGDLSLENTFEVAVHDAVLNPEGQNMVTTDFYSDGAECQQYHQCSTDNDCATTLGWDYACAPVNEITTSWPRFDDNGNEIPELTRDENRLFQILGTPNPGKRCVYRGRGSLCSQNYNSILSTSSYTTTTTKAFHACSSANYCQTLYTGGNLSPSFNNKISRYGKTRSSTTEDSFGLGAPLPGRPLKFNGNETIASAALPNIVSNKAISMCLPGKSVDQLNFVAQNRTTPTHHDFKGDRVLGIGQTLPSTTLQDPNYLNACSIMDSNKNFYHLSSAYPTTNFSSSVHNDLRKSAGSQAISTNALSIFKSIFQQKSITYDIMATNTALLNKISYTEARCLRAPGSACFSDQECAPSKAIADKIKSISASDTSIHSILNKYEILFWQEELVCGQAISKTDPLYDPKNNTCCREVGKKVTLPSANVENGLNMTLVPGLDISYNNRNRYSRASTIYKEVGVGSNASHPTLLAAVKDECSSGSCLNTTTGLNLKNQQKTFGLLASRTSCTGHWVRDFATGGHKWEASRFQTFATANFRCMNWLPYNPDMSQYSNDFGLWNCANFSEDDPTCPIIQTLPTSADAKGVFNFLGKLELMGIPQIAIESEDFYNGTMAGALSCKTNPASRNTSTHPYPPVNSGASYIPIPGLFADTPSGREYHDGTNSLYSAIDHTNFKNMKQIFSADTVSTCHPAGTVMPQGSDPNLCCTGMINSSNNKCQLPDYIDLSVYTNRFVSSEAKDLNDALFDEHGYVKDPIHVAQLACAKSMCASNAMATGILVSRLKIPGQTDSSQKYYRFLEGSATSDNVNGLLDIYNKGLKINTHMYCIPSSLANSGNTGDLNVITCEN